MVRPNYIVGGQSDLLQTRHSYFSHAFHKVEFMFLLNTVITPCTEKLKILVNCFILI